MFIAAVCYKIYGPFWCKIWIFLFLRMFVFLTIMNSRFASLLVLCYMWEKNAADCQFLFLLYWKGRQIFCPMNSRWSPLKKEDMKSFVHENGQWEKCVKKLYIEKNNNRFSKLNIVKENCLFWKFFMKFAVHL